MDPTASPTNLRIIDGLGADARNSETPALPLDQKTYDRALDCVHCGLCLPACPTYTQNGLEADSPRGRIHLIKGMADGRIEPTEAVLDHLDLCLDCQACETACPSGVVYHELIEATRAHFNESPPPNSKKRRGFSDRFVDFMFYKVFPYPRRLKFSLLPPRLMQKVGLWGLVNAIAKRLPARLHKMHQMLPPRGPLWEQSLTDHYPADKTNCDNGKPRATIALLAGCVGSVLFQHVNRKTIRLLQHSGCDVIVPRSQGCCGAIHHHGGHEEQAKEFARNNIDAFIGPPDSAYNGLTPTIARRPDYIVTNIAGCGAALKDYASLLRDDNKYRDAAKKFEDKVRDISEILVEFPPPKPTHSFATASGKPATATYHDACHLAHAQRVTNPPRQLLSWLDGLNIIPLPESDMCCGAAGTYNLSQPDMAMQLAERKIQHIQSTGASLCITGNVGCAMQIQSEAARLGVELIVKHPVEVLYDGCFGNGE